MQNVRAILASAALVLLTACSPLNRSVPEGDLIRSDRYQIIAGINAPKVEGPRGCGAQALAASLAHADPAQSAADIAGQLPWHKEGATAVELLLEARRRGFDATIERGTLERLTSLINGGQPAVVMIDAGPKVRGLFATLVDLPPKLMHWALVSGMARDQSQVLLAAVDHRHYIASQNDFLKRWAESDNCLIVVRARGNGLAGDSSDKASAIAASRPATPR